MKIELKRRVDLSDCGDGWKGAYIEVVEPTVRDMLELSNAKSGDEDKLVKEFIRFIKKIFVSGSVVSEGKLVQMSVKDIEDLPFSIMTKVVNFLQVGGTLTV